VSRNGAISIDWPAVAEALTLRVLGGFGTRKVRTTMCLQSALERDRQLLGSRAGAIHGRSRGALGEDVRGHAAHVGSNTDRDLRVDLIVAQYVSDRYVDEAARDDGLSFRRHGG
jgi:hypothetical protein